MGGYGKRPASPGLKLGAVVLGIAAVTSTLGVSHATAAETLPREVLGIRVGVTYEVFRAKLKELQYKIKSDDTAVGPITGLAGRTVVLKSPSKEFSQIVCYFGGEDKLAAIRVDYDLVAMQSTSDDVLAQFRERYGPPDELKERTDDIFGFVTRQYYWRDDRTELEVGYLPPGKDPLGRPHFGSVDHQLSDRVLQQRRREENARDEPPALKAQRERQQRAAEERRQYLAHLEHPPEPYQKGQALFADHCNSCHVMGDVPALKRRAASLIGRRFYHPVTPDGSFFDAVRDGAKDRFNFGMGDMPPIPGVSEDEVREIVKYVRWAQAEEDVRYQAEEARIKARIKCRQQHPSGSFGDGPDPCEEAPQ